MCIAKILNKDDKFHYQLLHRMRSDCGYFSENRRIYGNFYFR